MDVLILMGSKSDLEIMQKAEDTLVKFGLECEMRICSAHRMPDKLSYILNDAIVKGVKVIIAGAGMAAHLPGVVASQVEIPVIGVPIASGPLEGKDALYSIVQMPPDIPVATVAINGAKNAGLLAAQIIDPSHIIEYRIKMKKNLKVLAETIF